MSRTLHPGLLLLFAGVVGGLWLAGQLLPGTHAVELDASAPEASIPVRIDKASGASPVHLELLGRFRILTEGGAVLHEGADFTGTLTFDAAGARLGPLRPGLDRFYLVPDGHDAITLGDQRYNGRLRIEVGRAATELPERVDVILEVPLEEYVAGVVCGEMPTSMRGAGEALRAQAVAARTYATWMLGRGHRWLRDTPAHQRFLSLDLQTREGRLAARDTSGEVLHVEGEVLAAWYHADCGGATADAAAVQFLRRPLGPLGGREEPDCRRRHSWEHVVEAAELDDLASHHGLGPAVLNVQVTARDEEGRILQARLDGARASKSLHGEDVRRAFGTPSALWSALEARADGSLVVSGRGRGHGVGLCQEGALDRSQAGADYREILEHYYPGATLAPRYGALPSAP